MSHPYSDGSGTFGACGWRRRSRAAGAAARVGDAAYAVGMTQTYPFGQDHVRIYQETGGEQGYRWKRGTEILLLTTTGRKSGERKVMPLIYREIDGDYVIVASKGGHPDHPAWFKNLEAHPDDVEVQIRDEQFRVRPRVAEGDERARLWDAMNEVWPDYASYQERTGRQIPVVVLERA
jgi:deazaflavin-dependent oxidoreductase (nitroreductase family)